MLALQRNREVENILDATYMTREICRRWLWPFFRSFFSIMQTVRRFSRQNAEHQSIFDVLPENMYLENWNNAAATRAGVRRAYGEVLRRLYARDFSQAWELCSPEMERVFFSQNSPHAISEQQLRTLLLRAGRRQRRRDDVSRTSHVLGALDWRVGVRFVRLHCTDGSEFGRHLANSGRSVQEPSVDQDQVVEKESRRGVSRRTHARRILSSSFAPGKGKIRTTPSRKTNHTEKTGKTKSASKNQEASDRGCSVATGVVEQEEKGARFFFDEVSLHLDVEAVAVGSSKFVRGKLLRTDRFRLTANCTGQAGIMKPFRLTCFDPLYVGTTQRRSARHHRQRRRVAAHKIMATLQTGNEDVASSTTGEDRTCTT